MTNETENLGTRFRIDASRSDFTVQAFAEGLLSFMGHNPTFAVRRYGGEVLFAAVNTEVDSMLLLAQADTLSVLDRVSEKDKAEIENTMRGDVLETARYPEVVFVSKDISMKKIAEGRYRVQIVGELSLHGITRPHSIAAEAEMNGEAIRAVGEFALRLSDYNIKPVKALGGTLKVRDEVEFYFDILAQV